MIENIINRLKAGKANINTSYIREKASLFGMFYTGKNDYELLTQYKANETDSQKKQRDRITIRRSVPVCHQIEHTLDKLQTLDKAVINIQSKTKQDELEAKIYNGNISKLAFNLTKYYNLVDANSFVIAGVSDDGEVEFSGVTSASILDFKIINDNVVYLVFEDIDNRYVYTANNIYTLDKINNNITKILETTKCYAFHVGYILDSVTNFKTFKSLLTPSEELFKQLLWDGSEYDIIKAVHGIIKQFAYAQECRYTSETDKGVERCEGGTVFIGNETVGQCLVCNGSGLRIHTSNQDIIYLPEPMDGSGVKLSELTHTVFIPDSILETRKNDIQDLEKRILRTVFNTNQVLSEDTQRTAYEVKTENSGLIAQFYKLGEKVSDVFIWMCEIIADVIGAKEVTIFHGFTMDLNLDTLEDLFIQRKQAIESGTTNEVLAHIDTTILKKQHVDNPNYISKVMLWEKFKPFRTLSQNEKIIAIGSEEVYEDDKILWLNWDRIKSNIINNYETFYDMTISEQEEVFKIEIDKIKKTLSNETDLGI